MPDDPTKPDPTKPETNVVAAHPVVANLIFVSVFVGIFYAIGKFAPKHALYDYRPLR